MFGRLIHCLLIYVKKIDKPLSLLDIHLQKARLF